MTSDSENKNLVNKNRVKGIKHGGPSIHGCNETSSSRLTGQIQCQAMPEKPARAWEPSSFERCSASADMVVDGENSKIRGTRTESM